MTTKYFSHTVRVPPMTDVKELVGQYHSLFNTLGIPVESPFPATMGFTHPIEAENQKLTMEFFETMNILKSTMMQFITLKLANTRVQNTSVTFVFEYNE